MSEGVSGEKSSSFWRMKSRYGVIECASPSSQGSYVVRVSKTGFNTSEMSNVRTPRSQYETYAFMPSALTRALWPNIAPNSPCPQNGPGERLFAPAPQSETSKGTLGFVTSMIRKSPPGTGSNHSLNGVATSA